MTWVSQVGPGTLREELNLRGYTDHSSDRFGAREIRRGSRRVAVKDADACWRWLARLDRKVRALRGAL